VHRPQSSLGNYQPLLPTDGRPQVLATPPKEHRSQRRWVWPLMLAVLLPVLVSAKQTPLASQIVGNKGMSSRRASGSSVSCLGSGGATSHEPNNARIPFLYPDTVTRRR